MSHTVQVITSGKSLTAIPIYPGVAAPLVISGVDGATGPAGPLGPLGPAGPIGPTGPLSPHSPVTGDLVPDQSGVYDLGSLAKPFDDLYLTPGTIYFGDKLKIGVNPDTNSIITEPVIPSLDPTTWSPSGPTGPSGPTSYRHGSRVEHAISGLLGCYECDAPYNSVGGTIGSCCWQNECLEVPQAVCCDLTGTAFYPHVTCGEFDPCAAENAGLVEDPCDIYEVGNLGSVDYCGNEPGTIDSIGGWKLCEEKEEFITTSSLPPNCRLFKFGGHKKGSNLAHANKGEFILWRGANGANFDLDKLWYAKEPYDFAERLMISDIDSEGKATYKDDKYVWPRTEAPEGYGVHGGYFNIYKKNTFGSKREHYLKYHIRMPSVAFLRDSLIYKDELKFTSIPDLEKACKDGGNVEITYSFVPEGVTIEHDFRSADKKREGSINHALLDHWPAKCKTLNWGRVARSGPDFSNYTFKETTYKHTSTGLENIIKNRAGGDWSNTTIDRTISSTDIRADIASAFDEWANLFNSVYSKMDSASNGGKAASKLNLTFKNLGLENTTKYDEEVNGQKIYEGAKKAHCRWDKVKNVDRNTYAIKNSTGYPGDIRCTMAPYNVNKSHYFALSVGLNNQSKITKVENGSEIVINSLGKVGGAGGDISFNSTLNWRLDNQKINKNTLIESGGTFSSDIAWLPDWMSFSWAVGYSVRPAGQSSVFPFWASPWSNASMSPTGGFDLGEAGPSYSFRGVVNLFPNKGGDASLKMTALHEIGHALGFDHEDHREHRAAYVYKSKWDEQMPSPHIARPEMENEAAVLAFLGKTSYSGAIEDPLNPPLVITGPASHMQDHIFLPVARTRWKDKLHVMMGFAYEESVKHLWPKGIKEDACSREYAETFGRLNQKEFNNLGYRGYTIYNLIHNKFGNMRLLQTPTLDGSLINPSGELWPHSASFNGALDLPIPGLIKDGEECVICFVEENGGFRGFEKSEEFDPYKTGEASKFEEEMAFTRTEPWSSTATYEGPVEKI